MGRRVTTLGNNQEGKSKLLVALQVIRIVTSL